VIAPSLPVVFDGISHNMSIELCRDAVGALHGNVPDLSCRDGLAINTRLIVSALCQCFRARRGEAGVGAKNPPNVF
jgi:hypothetical protein